MKSIQTGTRISLQNILFLTDFSEPSEVALPFAVAVAREFGATIHALHVLLPDPYLYIGPETVGAAIQIQQENAEEEMKRVQAHLSSVPNDVNIERGGGLWPAVEREIARHADDLIVLGTHGRTGPEKLVLGSFAEEILRRVRTPVLTIGPKVRSSVHSGARFHRILFATDFTPESLAAMPYAVSFAQENQARLILLHVIRMRLSHQEFHSCEPSVASTMYELHKLVPADAELWCRPEAVVEYGAPGDGILEAAAERSADLIVLGVRGGRGHLGAATHLGNTTAHKIVAHAKCPVLTVRG